MPPSVSGSAQEGSEMDRPEKMRKKAEATWKVAVTSYEAGTPEAEQKEAVIEVIRVAISDSFTEGAKEMRGFLAMKARSEPHKFLSCDEIDGVDVAALIRERFGVEGE